ncbi:MAG: ATP-binding cassette domain-containing protein [Cyanosarcina radialis HA8281-LM2]|nr:ATP-binding cassette domain-containing protein [Cyanosarcina radialis HA8281-LM2]
MLQLEGVSLTSSIGSHYLLNDISFEVFSGDRLSIIGPSGAGKTSLLRLLNRLGEPSRGKLFLGDRNYQKISVFDLRRQVMLLLQEPKLLEMTVREALAYPLVLRGIKSLEIQQKIENLLPKLNIPEDWLDRTEVQLSVGQRQLVAIARAVIVRPQILLLDEPTSALDAGRAARIVQFLTELANSGETTILMVNHQLDLAQEFSDRVLYLENGNLLQDAPSDRIDWDELRDRLVKAEAQAAEEWS